MFNSVINGNRNVTHIILHYDMMVKIMLLIIKQRFLLSCNNKMKFGYCSRPFEYDSNVFYHYKLPLLRKDRFAILKCRRCRC